MPSKGQADFVFVPLVVVVGLFVVVLLVEMPS